jgi:hypothetical protein
VIYSNDAETVWNAFRLAYYSQSKGDTVSVFENPKLFKEFENDL